MRRATIRELADAAGVSVATVNRVLAGAANVRSPTRALIQDAAERIGFYGLGNENRVAASRPKYRLGTLLLQSHRPFYQNVAAALRRAAAETVGAEVDLRIEFLDDLSPQNTANRGAGFGRKLPGNRDNFCGSSGSDRSSRTNPEQRRPCLCAYRATLRDG